MFRPKITLDIQLLGVLVLYSGRKVYLFFSSTKFEGDFDIIFKFERLKLFRNALNGKF